MAPHPTKRVTLDDVARLAEVHKATVSRALNAATASQISAETVERVQSAARALGYAPNMMARGLRTNLSTTVGIVIPDLTNPIFPPIVRGIERVLQPRGYTALLANTDGDEAVAQTAFESLLQRQVDGFILATGTVDAQPLITRAQRDGVLVVMVNREAGASSYPAVIPDNEQGIESALEHLHDLGHRRIAHLAGPKDYSTARRRSQAFERVTGAMGDVRGVVVVAGALTVDGGERAMHDLLARSGARSTAVVAGNDLMALGAIRSLRSHGLRCPEDVSVVGFNDMPFAGDFSPSLTTVHVPLADLGAEAARILLKGIEGGAQDAVTVMLPVSLVVRGSTGPASS